MLAAIAFAAAVQVAPVQTAPAQAAPRVRRPVPLGSAYDPSNPFARILRGELAAAKVAETAGALAFMDNSPVLPGHVLVIPKAPVVSFLDASPTQIAAVMSLARCVADAQRKALAPDGMTGLQVRMNSGAPDQEVGHMHLHLLPRYGDRPFAPPTAMLPAAALEPMAARIRAALPPGGC